MERWKGMEKIAQVKKSREEIGRGEEEGMRGLNRTGNNEESKRGR